jgi:hypothetical protein
MKLSFIQKFNPYSKKTVLVPDTKQIYRPPPINPNYRPPPSIRPNIEPKPTIEINGEYITVKIQQKEYKIKINPEDIFKEKINKTCLNGNNLTNNDVKQFLDYIQSFIQSFINNSEINRAFGNNHIYERLKIIINHFNNKIIEGLLQLVILRSGYAEYKYSNNDIPSYAITSIVSEIKNCILTLKRISKELISIDEKSSYYIHHICIILRKILLDLINIINKIPFTLEYIPIEYMKSFIYKIHFKNKCLQTKGGADKNYKKTENQITVIYNKKKYTRNIYINERKKYIKINKTYMLLSKLKKI